MDSLWAEQKTINVDVSCHSTTVALWMLSASSSLLFCSSMAQRFSSSTSCFRRIRISVALEAFSARRLCEMKNQPSAKQTGLNTVQLFIPPPHILLLYPCHGLSLGLCPLQVLIEISFFQLHCLELILGL